MVAQRLIGLVSVAVGVGCSFETSSSNDSSQLGSSVGTEATASDGDETESSSGADSASGEGSTGFVGGSTSVGSSEACVDVCAPIVPDSWKGPFHVVDAANPIECPEGFARQDLGFRGLTAPPPTCGCDCVESGGDCHVDYRLSISGCPIGLDGTLQNGSCNGFNALGADVHMLAQLDGSPVSCAPEVSMNVAEPTWESASTFCAAPARGGDCGAQECIAGSPDGFATQLCISSDGDVDCPGGGWETRTLLYRSFQDDRTCTGCTCSGPTACEAQATAHDNGSCGGTPQDVPLSSCTDINVSGSYSVGAVVDNGTCEQSNVMPAGEVEPSDAVTLCCAS